MRTVYQIGTIPSSGVKITLEGQHVRILFDFEKIELEGDDKPKAKDLYYCESIDASGRGYGDIISAIVNDRYSADENQALMANYELAKDATSAISYEKRAEYLAEYSAYQDWRAHAKEIAQLVVSQIENK